MSYLNKKYLDLDNYALENREKYANAEPFPHIVIDNLFNENILNSIIDEFPNNLDQIGNNFSNKVEKKLSLNKSVLLSHSTNNFINFLNSQIFLDFLQKLTSIKEKLVPDPYLLGGGLHELRKNGYLNIHADFNLHPSMKLDRRLNILIYLNKNWQENYGGSLQLWDKDMKKCERKILPEYNRMVISPQQIFLTMEIQIKYLVLITCLENLLLCTIIQMDVLQVENLDYIQLFSKRPNLMSLTEI